ncbi:lactonase family protein [Chitinophaga defluvii]|uniref:Lactonase family protein n=1 Tax=Chitinophaga defluvii TaxID=3163343 RepID=A0ABV2TA34_9BACT
MRTLILLCNMLLLPFLLPAQSAFYIIVGTYTQKESKGIYVYKFDATTGTLTYVSTAEGVENPSYLTVAPGNKQVYAVSEWGKGGGQVAAFSFDAAKGQLQQLNKQSSGGDGPCYINTDAAGKNVVVGNYSGGSLAVLKILPDGNVSAPVQTIQHSGTSVNKKRQEKAHVHCVEFSPDQQYLYVPDLGIDQVKIYKYNADAATPLTPANPSFAPLFPGAGPRHIVFHTNRKWAYVIRELDGKVTAFRYSKGKLTEFQSITMLPEDFKGVISGADIHLSPDGKFLYASNRGDLNNIVIYTVNAKSGQLQYVGQHTAAGKSPRNFVIDPTGNYLLVANQDTDNIVVLKRDATTGLLTPTGQEVKVSMPVCLKMIPM